jgi:hypothetical protein
MKKKNRVPGDCSAGHDINNVAFQIFRRIGGKISSVRYKCRCCGMKMNVAPNQSLIGNPFGIKQLTDAYKSEIVFHKIDEALKESEL